MEKADGLRDVERIRAAVAASPELAELADASTRRRRFYEVVAENPDPIWREIGQQLRDGRLRPSEVLSVPEYRERLRAGMADGLTRLTQAVGALEEHLRADRADQASAGEAEVSKPAEDLSDVEDLSEMLGPILRRR